jgi:hypothetical protein
MSQHLAARATALLSARLAPRIDLTCGGRQAARADIILRVKAQELALASRGCFPTAALDEEPEMEVFVEEWEKTARAVGAGRQVLGTTTFLPRPLLRPILAASLGAHDPRPLDQNVPHQS